MAIDPLQNVRWQIGARLAEIKAAGPRLSPMDMHRQMDAIRELAQANGLPALETLARHSAQLSLLPGHRIALQSCLEHVEEAMDSCSPGDGPLILAALAARLH